MSLPKTKRNCNTRTKPGTTRTRKSRACNCQGLHHSGACKRRRGVSSTGPTREARKGETIRASWRRAYNFGVVDGEAVGDKFIMLACSDGSSIENPDGLKTFDCLQYLTTREYKTLWGFAFDYDVNQILSGLTITQLENLKRKNWAYYGDFYIKHIPSKMLRITNRSKGRTVTIWDAFSFIRSSFTAWLDDWGLASGVDLKFIEKMKDLRSTFTFDQVDEIRRYCFLELDYLERGVKELLKRVEATGLRPRSWYSPGSISAEAMRSENVTDYMPDKKIGVNLEIMIAAQEAYYGGRFETRIIGEIPGPLFHYDINSAYPYGLTKLPCLRCGSWEAVRSVDLAEPGNLVLITWRKVPFQDPAKRPPWGPFPVRLGAGSLRYPIVNDKPAWYWSDEVYAARTLTSVKIHTAYRFRGGCDHDPFAFIHDLYKLRQQLKAEGDPAEYVYKLVINSCYGKLAQRPRKRNDKLEIPRFNMPLWSGRITAICRAQMLEAMAQDPAAILQTATDGLTSFEKLDLPLSKELGDWGVKEIAEMMIVQSGIYFWRDHQGAQVQRSRGFHPKTMTYDLCREAWRTDPTAPLTFENRRFVGYRTALHRGDLSLWRQWLDYDVNISMLPEPRRERFTYKDGYLVSVPPVRAEPWVSDLIFPPDFQLLRDWEAEQPDGPDGGSL